MSTTDTVIIGAGPYGLSLAAHLSAAGVPHQILGKPMHAWRDFMPAGMLMRSDSIASNLYAPQRGHTIEDYCAHKGIAYQPVGTPITRETFVDYALWFQQRLVSHVRTVDVLQMQRVNGQFHLKLSDGSAMVARRVVMALGLRSFEKTPAVLQGMPREFVSHSAEYGSLDWVREKDIVIVGGGQSALGLAALMHEAGGRIRVLARESALTWNNTPDTARSLLSRLLAPEGRIGPGWASHIVGECPYLFRALPRRRRIAIVSSTWGPSGAWWLRDRVIGKIDVSLASQIRHAAVENNRIVLRVASGSEETQIDADHVVAATGFKTDISRHTFLSKEIVQSMSLADGVPELTRNFETAVRGLYVIGPASANSFGPVMRFVYGAKYAAPHVARHISRLYRQRTQMEPTVSPSTAADTAVN